jgi:acetyltransferase-like isoleucine patch superfamily enzyme
VSDSSQSASGDERPYALVSFLTMSVKDGLVRGFRDREWARKRALGRLLSHTPGVTSGGGVLALTPVRVRRVGPGRIELGSDVHFHRAVVLELRTAVAVIEIGSGSFVNDRCLLVAEDRITIGADCLLSWNVNIIDSNGHTLNGARAAKPVTVGDHVWIGANVTVLPGVTVGDGAVIGAGSVVTRNVRPGSLVAGNPASEVRKQVDWVR